MRTGAPLAAIAALTALAACATDAGPPGGDRPALAAVPAAVAPRYDAFERTVLKESLRIAGSRTRAQAAGAEARLAGAAPTVRPEPAPAAVLPEAAAPADTGPPPVAVEDTLVMADDLVELAEAVLRDRRELDRRARILAAAAQPPDDPWERLTVVAFAPASTTLDAFERRRLEQAVSFAGPVEDWQVVAGGARAAERAAAVRAALVDTGVGADAVRVVAGDRDVDVAAVRVRR